LAKQTAFEAIELWELRMLGLTIKIKAGGFLMRVRVIIILNEAINVDQLNYDC